MRIALRWLGGAVVGSLIAVASTLGTARADVPPPDGKKYVEYSFRVDNVQSFPDWVLVAYPCSSTKAAFNYKGGIVITSDAPVSVGGGFYSCAIYAMKRDQWTAWRSANPAPTAQDADDLALDALVSSGQMLHCDGGPQPQLEADESGPDAITDTVHVQTLTDTTCQLAVDEREDDAKGGCSVQPAAKASRQGSSWAVCCAGLAMIALRRRSRRG